MREFRILGPLEALLDGSPVDLGGQRQRALLAALLVHHGQVVSTDRLVDLLWGEQRAEDGDDVPPERRLAAPTRARRTTSSRRAPRATSSPPTPHAIDAVRFETLLGAGAQRARRRAGAALLRSALALWRGPALADLAGEEFTQGEIRRLEELRLDALEERIAADIELGLHREVIGELETLAAATPLRERVCALRMLALYRSGRQAEALQAFRDTRARVRRRARDRAGRGAPGAARADPAPGGGARRDRERDGSGGGRERDPPGAAGGTGRPRARARRCRRSSRSASATSFDVPANVRGSLGRVTQYVAAMQGLGPLHDELHADLRGRRGSRSPVHRLLARLPALLRERGVPTSSS